MFDDHGDPACSGSLPSWTAVASDAVRVVAGVAPAPLAEHVDAAPARPADGSTTGPVPSCPTPTRPEAAAALAGLLEPFWFDEMDEWVSSRCPAPEEDPLFGQTECHGATVIRREIPQAEELPTWEPSAEAAALLAGADPDLMSDRELVEAVALWGRIASWSRAQQADLAAHLDTRPVMRPTWSPKAGRVAEPRVTPEELAARLGCSRHTARGLVREGRAYQGALAPTGEALSRGLIDQAKARELVRALDEVALEVAVLVQERVLPEAPRLTPRQLAERIREALVEVDPEDTEHRVARATAGRRVDAPRMRPDGMAGTWVLLPAPAAVAMNAELDLVARELRDSGDERTLDQLRADALVAAVLARHLPTDGTASSEEPVTRRTPSNGDPVTGATAEHLHDLGRMARHLAETPVRAQVHVTVPLDVLLDESQAAGHLEGYGAIDATTAQALARGGTWRRLVTDPLSGMVHDVGRTRYAPPPDMTRYVRARDATCVVPDCSTPARSCEIDHTVPFGDPGRDDGGRTATDNLGALCKRHHLLKTHAGFALLQDAPGVFTWITPTGQRVRRHPRQIGRPRRGPMHPTDALITIRRYIGIDSPDPVGPPPWPADPAWNPVDPPPY